MVRFVDILETELLEGGLLDGADLGAWGAHIKVLRDDSVRNNVCVLLLCADKYHNIDVWSLAFEFARAILEGRLGTTMRCGLPMPS